MTSATAKRITPNDIARPAAIKRRLVAAAPDDPAPVPTGTTQMDVTPALAAGWLLRNTRNRSVRIGSVAAMARDMKAGRWIFAGGVIGFDTNGVLVDGQHRLMAVIESGTTQRFIIAPSLAPDAMSVVDTGSKRSTADVLSLSDDTITNPSVVAATIRIAVAAETGRLASNDVKATNGEITDWLNEHRNVLEYTRRVSATARHFDAPAAVIAYSWWKCASVDVFEANQFFEDWMEVRTNGRGDPLHTLYKRLQAAKKSNERLQRPVQVALIFRAWNGRRRGETLQSMPISSRSGRIDIPEPK
jgi:hypothetical protein